MHWCINTAFPVFKWDRRCLWINKPGTLEKYLRYLTVQFSAPIANDPANPYGLDFSIFGNTGFVTTSEIVHGGGITNGSLLGDNPGSTRVSVRADNLTFYHLNLSLAPVVDGL